MPLLTKEKLDRTLAEFVGTLQQTRQENCKLGQLICIPFDREEVSAICHSDLMNSLLVNIVNNVPGGVEATLLLAISVGRRLEQQDMLAALEQEAGK